MLRLPVSTLDTAIVLKQHMPGFTIPPHSVSACFHIPRAAEGYDELRGWGCVPWVVKTGLEFSENNVHHRVVSHLLGEFFDPLTSECVCLKLKARHLAFCNVCFVVVCGGIP